MSNVMKPAAVFELETAGMPEDTKKVAVKGGMIAASPHAKQPTTSSYEVTEPN